MEQEEQNQNQSQIQEENLNIQESQEEGQQEGQKQSYSNKIITETESRHLRSKLTTDQLNERVELHAHRKLFGWPKIKTIADHWHKKYNISIHQQSEKEWALNNEKIIDACIKRKINSGEWEPSTLSVNSIKNTLSVAAASKAEIIKSVKDRTKLILKDFDKASMEERKEISLIAKNLADVSHKESAILVEMLKVALSNDVESKGIKKAEDIIPPNSKDKVKNFDPIEIVDNIEEQRKLAGIE